MDEHFTYTGAILDKAEKLKEGGRLTWPRIAERLGCSRGSLEKTLSLRRKGIWKGSPERQAKERKEIERLVVEEGKGVSEIARLLGVSKSAVSQRLTRMGLDLEIRQEIARGEWDES